MEVIIGEEGLKKSWQNAFPKEVTCCKPSCAGEARIGFVVIEEVGQDKYIAHLHENDPDGEGLWLHDACAVAVYFCRQCLEPTAHYNQA